MSTSAVEVPRAGGSDQVSSYQIKFAIEHALRSTSCSYCVIVNVVGLPLGCLFGFSSTRSGNAPPRPLTRLCFRFAHAGLPVWLAAPPTPTDLSLPPLCSHSPLPRPIDPTVDPSVDGNPMHSPLYRPWWMAVHGVLQRHPTRGGFVSSTTTSHSRGSG